MVVLVMQEMCRTTLLKNPAVIATDVNMNVRARNNRSSRINLQSRHLQQDHLRSLHSQKSQESTLVAFLVLMLHSKILSSLLNRMHQRPQDHV